MKIDGRQIASEILEELKIRVKKLRAKGIIPHLYIILLTDNPSTLSYIRQKLLYAEKIGTKITVDTENPKIETKALLSKIKKLNENKNIHGIIVQRPAPEHLDFTQIDNFINPKKEIDGFASSKFTPPVALAVNKILEVVYKNKEDIDFNTWLKGESIVVIGKGKTAGTPIISFLKRKNLQPLVVDSKTKNPEREIKKGDIIISTTGKAGVVRINELKEKAILIGVGMHKEKDGKFHGDFEENDVLNKVLYYTPTPGGVGPVNVACLLQNLIEAAETLSK